MYKHALLRIHSKLQQQLSVGLGACKKRYELARIGAEKSRTYAVRQKAAMEAKRMEALGSYRRAVKSFNILTKKVRFIDYPMDPVTDIVPEGHEKVSRFKGLVELIEKRLRRKERVLYFLSRWAWQGWFPVCMPHWAFVWP